jgi:hypothetical protein
VGNANGFAFDENDNLVVRRVIGGVQVNTILLGGAVTSTASEAVTVSQTGSTIVANSTTSVVVTLPTAAPGLTYTLVVGQVTSSGGHAFSPAAADFITGDGLTAVVDKDLICTAATDAVGDSVTIVGADGGWYVTAITGTWAKEG